MSPLAEILDRLSDVSTLREKTAQQDRVLESMQRIVLEQQRELAEIKGTLRALRALVEKQAAAPPRPSLANALSSLRQPHPGGQSVSLQSLAPGKLDSDRA